MHTLHVGVISETLVQQHHLRLIVEECAFQVEAAWLITQVLTDVSLLASVQNIDVWLVDVDTFSLPRTDNTLIFERWLFELNVPVIFGEGTTLNTEANGFSSWSKQLTGKLVSVSSHLAKTCQRQPPAECVWVLAASTGGPAAVKAFLDRLPSGLGVSLIYAQHNEERHNSCLVDTLVRESAYHCKLAEHGDRLFANTVTLVPCNQQLDILSDGTLILCDKPWRGDYSPSIDQVVATVANCFGSRSGAIYFSGMGDDGAMGARLMARYGGYNLIQVPASCISDSMPLSVNRTGTVTTSGTPEQLAAYLEKTLKAQQQASFLG